ncbi:MAG TPA: Yip1 family protein [Bryobacteraceae bacterium]|nr:Yip1 family protein [Bryobacteraceae bacterium]
MTPESTADNATPPLGELGRITGVYLDPKKAFTDIVARPGWIVPAVLLIVVAVAFTYTYTTKIGWDRYFHQIAETNTRMQQLDPQQRENAIQQQTKFAPIGGYVFSVIGIPVSMLIVGGVLLLVGKMGGASSLRYKQTLGIASYGMLPGLISSILAIVVMFLKNPDDFNLQNPLAFNLGAFLAPPPNTGKFVYGVAKSFDLFTIWMILLMAVGLSVASKKMAFSKAVILIVVPWLIWVLATSGLAGMFG